MTSRRRRTQEALLMTVVAAVVLSFATSCQSSNDEGAVSAAGDVVQDASASEATADRTTVVDDDEPAKPSRPVSHVDLADIAQADARAAQSVLALAASSAGDRSMAPGPWFSSTYSEALAFDLPVTGRLVDQGLGWTTIEVGEPGTGTHGLLRIVEAVALSSPDGPIPISLIGPDSEFADTTLLDRGTVESPIADDAHWRDVVLEGELVPQQFQVPCGFGSGDTCVDALIAEGGPLLIEVDRTTRFVSQPFGSRRLYVSATALGSDEDGVLDLAFQLAASLVTTDRVEEVARRPMSTIGIRADAIPAGSWFVDLDGVTVDFVVAEEAVGVSVLDVGTTWLALQSTDETGDQWVFSVQVFQGFVQGALVGDDAAVDLPLPAEVFLRGMDAIAPLEAQGSGTMGGYPSRWYVPGDHPADSPWTCTAFERRDLEPSESCVVFSSDGWRLVDDGDGGSVYFSHYVEEFGVAVAFPGRWNGDEFVVDPAFRTLLAGLTLRAR